MVNPTPLSAVPPTMPAPETLFGWSPQTWDLLDKLDILLGDAITFLTILSILVGFMKRKEIRRWFTTNRFPSVGGALTEARNFEGLVFTISKADTPRWVIEQSRPEYVGLIHTHESGEVANLIRDFAKAMNAKVLTEEISDPDDPYDTHQAATALLGRMKQAGKTRLAVDITGGKVPMSVGAFMAAEEHGATSLYVACRFDPQLKMPDMTTARLTRVSQPAT